MCQHKINIETNEYDKVYLEGSTRMSLIASQNDSSRSGKNEVGSAIEVEE